MSTPSPTRDALVVGICQYDDLPMSEQLFALAKRAEQLAKLLQTQGGFKVTPLPCIEKKVKVGDSEQKVLELDLKQRVTLAELEQAIIKLLSPPEESPTDTALLFFAGHGLVKEKEGFLATSEADGKDVYGFPLKTLRELLQKSPVKQLIVFLESCYSGDLLTDFEETFKDDSHDICFITSARAHEEALADGLLTQALLELLDYTNVKEYPEKYGYVTDKLLLERLPAKVRRMEGWQRLQWRPEIQKRSIVLTNVAYTQKELSDAEPYRGLDYFKTSSEDALFFKGRDQLIEKLLNTVEEKRFLAVYGASGNGKSSVVRAGLLYQLPQKFPYQVLPVITPGQTPVASLRAIVDEAKQIIDQTQRVVLTVDQFEEVFASACTHPERQTFFELLFNLVEDISRKFSVILVIRSDFLGKFLENSPDSVKNDLILVKPPEDHEVRQMIVEPAKRAGFSVEPHLVAEMVADFRKLEVGLPFLEFALTTLWERGKTGRLLKYEDYENSGKIAGILESEANKHYQSFSAEEQIVVQRIFLELTDLKGKSDTRRPVLYDHLLALPYPSERIEKVIHQLVEQRLITVDKPQDAPVVVNLAHETLIQHWSLFHDWLQEFREDATKQRRLEEDAQAHSDGKKSLLTGLDLGNAEAYLKIHQARVPLTEKAVQFVQKSIKQRRKARRFWADLALAVFLGLSVLAGWALLEREEADKQRDYAQQQEQLARINEKKAKYQAQTSKLRRLSAQAILATKSLNPFDGGFDRALLLAAQVFKEQTHSREAQGTLLRVMNSFDKKRPKIIAHLQGHSAMDIAFSPDGKILASAGMDDNTIILWDMMTQKPLGKPLQGHSSRVRSVAFRPDGKILASGGEDDTIILWDVVTHQPIGLPLQWHSLDVSSVGFSPDGKILASGSHDKTVILWDVATQKPLDKPLQGHSNIVSDVTFSPDGKTLASSSGDKTIILWDVNTRQSLDKPLVGHHDSVDSIVFSPDGKTLASGSWDKTVILWDVATHQPIGEPLRGHDTIIVSVAFSSDGKTLASSSEIGTVMLWNITTRPPIGIPLQGHAFSVDSVAFSPNSQILAAGSTSGVIILWDMNINTILGTMLQGHDSVVTDVTFNPDGRILASSSWDKTIILWDVSTHQQLGESLQGHTGMVSGISFSPDGRILASSSWDKSVILWDVSTHQPLGMPLQGYSTMLSEVGVVFSPDGRNLASAGDHGLILWDVKTGQPIEELLHSSEFVTSIAFSPDSETLASGGINKIILWDRNTRQPLGAPLTGQGSQFDSVVFSPDGKILAGGDWSHSIILWDTKTHQLLGKLSEGHSRLDGHGGKIEDVAFSPDSQTLASGGSDRTVILWDVGTHLPIGEPLQGHGNVVTSVAFSPDGKTLASGSVDKTIILWDIDPQSWYEKACRIAGRNLNYEEWQRYLPDEPYQKTCPQYPEGGGSMPLS